MGRVRAWSEEFGGCYRMRRRILSAFEAAEVSSSEEDRRTALTFTVVGAGPTGVEMAGAIAELARRTLSEDFRHIDPRAARVLLLDGAPRILPTFPEDLSRSALAQLESMGFFDYRPENHHSRLIG